MIRDGNDLSSIYYLNVSERACALCPTRAQSVCAVSKLFINFGDRTDGVSV